MWNQHRSVLLSKILVLVFIVVLVGVGFTSPMLIRWLISYSSNAKVEDMVYFQLTMTLGCSLGILLLSNLYALLRNIGKNKVFISENTRYLRIISWVCIIGAVLCLVSSLYYLAWGVVGIAAGFMALIVRVVKNIMAQAIQIKEENDYTI